MVWKVDEKMGLSNSDIEDNPKVMGWRYLAACELTLAISKKWKSNSNISRITAKRVYPEKNYKRQTGILWWARFWTIYFREYIWNVS